RLELPCLDPGLDQHRATRLDVASEAGESTIQVAHGRQVADRRKQAHDRAEGPAQLEVPHIARVELRSRILLAGDIEHPRIDVDAHYLVSTAQVRDVTTGAAGDVQDRRPAKVRLQPFGFSRVVLPGVDRVVEPLRAPERSGCHASETRSSISSSQKSLIPSGISSTRPGLKASTKSLSWLTARTVPGQAARACAKASREGGSRLLVGSSRISRLWLPATIWASASLVFSPPDSVPASWKASSPWIPNMPRTWRWTRSSASVMSRMWSSTERPRSMPSCSCA